MRAVRSWAVADVTSHSVSRGCPSDRTGGPAAVVAMTTAGAPRLLVLKDRFCSRFCVLGHNWYHEHVSEVCRRARRSPAPRSESVSDPNASAAPGEPVWTGPVGQAGGASVLQSPAPSSDAVAFSLTRKASLLLHDLTPPPRLCPQM